MKKSLLTLVFCAAAMYAAAQNIVHVSGEYTYYAPSSMSLDQAKQEALLQTRLHVLGNKFGTIINSTTNLHLGNSESSDRVKSATEVHTYSVHEVKGEWIEDTREPEQTTSYDKSLPNTTIIYTRVWGKAREIVTAKIDIDVRLLKDTLMEAEADVFRHEQSFYVSFLTPVAGYVAIYQLDNDEGTAYCLLPTAIDSRGAIPVDSNKPYIFFSWDYAKKHYKAEDRSLGTGYWATTSSSIAFNQFYVIFSPNEFFKAKDKQEKDEQYILPRRTTIQEFNRWLTNCKIRDPQMVEKTISVKIVK